MILDTIPLSCALWLFFPLSLLSHFTIRDLLFGRKRETWSWGPEWGDGQELTWFCFSMKVPRGSPVMWAFLEQTLGGPWLGPVGLAVLGSA